MPCPIPFFECQSAFVAEHWARPSDGPDALTSADERAAWVAARRAAVGARTQDTHVTGAAGGSAWSYMRELNHAARAAAAERPPEAADAGEPCWLERPNWEARLTTVEEVYRDRGARYPKLPWHDDAYRRCEYTVDWDSGRWSVDDSRAVPSKADCSVM